MTEGFDNDGKASNRAYTGSHVRGGSTDDGYAGGSTTGNGSLGSGSAGSASAALSRSLAGAGAGASGSGGNRNGDNRNGGKRNSGGRKGKKNKKPWDRKSKVLLGIGTALLVVALCIGGYIGYGYISGRAIYSSIKNASGLAENTFKNILDGSQSLIDLQNIDWDGLRQINPDVVAWVYVEGTDINYPVVQGDDNDYYLHHAFDGTRNNDGCIFLDFEDSPDFTSDNNILYGHNMLDGSMFAQITKFKDQDFLNQNYRIIIATPSYAYVLSPAFTYICTGADELRQVNFSSQQELSSYIAQLMTKAVTDSIVDTSKIDKLFSLVTCSYEANDVRTVLCCVQRDAVTFPGK